MQMGLGWGTIMNPHKKLVRGFLQHSTHNTENKTKMKTAHFCFQKACLLDRQERICCCSVAACTLSAKESHSIRARFARRCSTEPYEHLLLSFRHIQNSHLSDTNRYQVTDALPPRDGCLHSDAILPLSCQWQSYRSHRLWFTLTRVKHGELCSSMKVLYITAREQR